MKRALQLTVIVSAAFGIAVAAIAVVGASAASPSWLPNCQGQPQAKPAEVIFACADDGFSALKLQWIGWGAATTAAVGTASINTCKPDCAAGHFESFRVVLVVDGSQKCPDGKTAYSTVSYAFIGRSPFAQNDQGTVDPSYSFRCR